MSEPDWLKKAREEGRILSETEVNDSEILSEVLRRVQAGDTSYTTRPAVPGLGISEAGFQEQVIAYAQLHGWKVAHCRKVRVQRVGGETYWETPMAADGKGWPDLVLAKFGRRGIAAELKVGRNTTTPEQIGWLALLADSGLHAVVWRPEDWEVIIATLSGEPS